MKIFSVILVLLFFLQALPRERSFEQRVQQAKQLEDTPEGKAYQQALGKLDGTQLANAMQRCFPTGARLDTKSFTWVGDVGSDARIHGVEVQPATSMTRCFADTFSQSSFPPIPDAFLTTGLPLEIDVQVTP